MASVHTNQSITYLPSMVQLSIHTTHLAGTEYFSGKDKFICLSFMVVLVVDGGPSELSYSPCAGQGQVTWLGSQGVLCVLWSLDQLYRHRLEARQKCSIQAPQQLNQILHGYKQALPEHTKVSEALLGKWRPAQTMAAHLDDWGSEDDKDKASQVLLTFIPLFPSLFQSVIVVFIYSLAYCFVTSRMYILRGSRDTILFNAGSLVPLDSLEGTLILGKIEGRRRRG